MRDNFASDAPHMTEWEHERASLACVLVILLTILLLVGSGGYVAWRLVQ